MKIQTGYLSHIKDEFFDIVNDENLMTNHERGKKRPTYFTIKDKEATTPLFVFSLKKIKMVPIIVEKPAIKVKRKLYNVMDIVSPFNYIAFN